MAEDATEANSMVARKTGMFHPKTRMITSQHWDEETISSQHPDPEDAQGARSGPARVSAGAERALAKKIGPGPGAEKCAK